MNCTCGSISMNARDLVSQEIMSTLLFEKMSICEILIRGLSGGASIMNNCDAQPDCQVG